MSFTQAKEIIDNEISRFAETHELTIEFFGGEPFLNFKLIKFIVDYCKKRYSIYNLHFCATTNGTALTDEIKKWLINNKTIFECSLSVDGTETMHNINRPYKNGNGSFSDIDIPFFISLYGKETRVKMTISRKTLPMLAEGIEFLDSMGVHVVADLAAEADYWRQSDIPVLGQQLERLITYYSKNSNQYICRMIDYDLRRVFMDDTIKFQYCGAGKNMITYDVDGKWYPCMALAPVSQGESAIYFIKESFEHFIFDSDNKCKDCGLLRLCRNCYATNYNQTGNIQHQTSIQCEMNRMLICASSKIQYNRIISKKEINEDDKWVLKAIWKIQDILKYSSFL